MPFPSETFLAQIQDPAVRQEFLQFVSLVQGYLSQQHKDDGSHSAIVADSLTLRTQSPKAGTVTGDVAPAVSATYDLGTQRTDGTQAVYGWRRLWLTDAIEWFSGAVNGVGVYIPSVTDILTAGGSRTTNFLVADTQTWVIKYLATVLATFGGSTGTSSGSLVLSGVTIPILSVSTNLYAPNGLVERTYTPGLGVPSTPTFAAGDFTGTGGTWTVIAGNVTTDSYTVIGKVCIYWFDYAATTVAAGATVIKRALPTGIVASKDVRAADVQLLDNGVASTGMVRVASSGTALEFFKDTSGTAYAGAGTTTVRGQISFPIT